MKKPEVKLSKRQLKIREKIILYTLRTHKNDEELSNQQIADIFNISRQALHKLEVRNGLKGKERA